MGRMQVGCHACGHTTTTDLVGVRDLCKCGEALHCCRNCEFFQTGVANDCREPNAERVADKTAGNFCDYFRPAATTARRGAPATNATRAALDALFRKKP